MWKFIHLDKSPALIVSCDYYSYSDQFHEGYLIWLADVTLSLQVSNYRQLQSTVWLEVHRTILKNNLVYAPITFLKKLMVMVTFKPANKRML